MNTPGIFVDRDGVVIWNWRRYVRRPEDCVWIPGAVNALARLSRAGYRVVLVTNQPGVDLGRLSAEDVRRVHGTIAQRVATLGGVLDGAYCCPHDAHRDCPCRKPRAGMLLQASEELGIDLRRSYVVGDRASDLYAGREAGVRGILVLTGWWSLITLLNPKARAAAWRVVPSLSSVPRLLGSTERRDSADSSAKRGSTRYFP